MCILLTNILVILEFSPILIHGISIAIIIAAFSILYVIQYKRFAKKYSKSAIREAIKEKYLLQQLINNMPDFIYYKDVDSRFLIVNEYMAKLVGAKSTEDLIGKTDMDVYDKDLASSFLKDEQELIKSGIALINKEEKGLNSKGEPTTILTTKIPIKDKNKKVIGLIGIGRDISIQKEAEKKLLQQSKNLNETNVLLEERQEEIQQMAEELNAQAENLKEINIELERLSLVASKTENVVIIMDGNANFEWVNHGFEKKYNTSFEKYVEEYGINLRDNSSNTSISAILNQINITHKPYTYTSKTTDKEGKESWNQTNISPIINSNNEITRLILIDSDVSNLKKAEIQIKQQNLEIEKQTRELQKLNSTKDRLFSIIAHDLKNPFHSILGFTDILQKKYQDIERKQLGEYLEMINESSTSAYRLLENLLEWARTQTNKTKIVPSKLDIRTLVDEVIALESLQASNKSIVLNNKTGSETGYADRNMLNTVIRNIMSNAIKFTSEGGSVTVTSSSTAEKVEINITDTGIGIPEEKIKNMFHLDKVTSTAGTAGETGTGLGLVVCHEFMLKNNGGLSVTSLPGKGSTFTLSFPVAKS